MTVRQQRNILMPFLMISWNFHGDRGVRDDNAIIGGIATLDGQPVTVIGIRKGHTTKKTSDVTSECHHRKGTKRLFD